MQKSKIITILIILIILIYTLISQVYFSTLGNIYTFIINPLFFVLLALGLKLFLIHPYSTNKYKKDIIQYSLITILFYCVIYLLTGLFTSYGDNPYISSIRGITINAFSTGLIIFCREYIRYKLMHNIFNKDKKIVFIFIVITFSLLDFNIVNFFNSHNLYLTFKQIFSILVPSIIKNILFTYLVIHTDYIPSFIYEIVFNLILWISPILPNSPWVLNAILDSVFPFILLLYCRYHIEKNNRFHLSNISKPFSPTGLIPFAAALVLLIWFALGIFPIKPVGIATASMYPELKVGDLVIIKKCTANDIKLQDVIEYQMDKYTVIHRVIEINHKNGEFIFTTKGDNNDTADNLPVREDQLLGKAIFKIPYLAFPSILLNKSNKTQVEVQTGK